MIHEILNTLNQPAFHMFGAPTSWTEVLGFVTGLACVYLVVKEHLWNFPVAITNTAFFLLLFMDAKLYADGVLQVIYMVLAIWGWYVWLHFKTDDVYKTTPVTSSWKIAGLTVIGIAAGTGALYIILKDIGDAAPFRDAVTTSLSIGAQILLNYKIIQNWYFWIVADLIYIPLYASQKLYLTAIVYIGFMALCFMGLREWKRSMTKNDSFGAKSETDLQAGEMVSV